ncbi:MAG: hypothetical protein IRY97_09780 [Thermomicrobiaceae bacterium]|nr:hypothetical protein [Thermomicrobiaceae bacterium]
MSPPASEPVDPGLCATCRHAERVRGARSTFWLCGRSRVDPAFPRYPRLPVRACRGYEHAGTPGADPRTEQAADRSGARHPRSGRGSPSRATP